MGGDGAVLVVGARGCEEAPPPQACLNVFHGLAGALSHSHADMLGDAGVGGVDQRVGADGLVEADAGQVALQASKQAGRQREKERLPHT